MTATTTIPMSPELAEPDDLAARVLTTTGMLWACDPRTRRWRPLGREASGYPWATLRYFFPDAEVFLPARSNGRVIPSRTTDPATSKQAAGAVKVRAGSQRARLLAAFGKYDEGHPNLSAALVGAEPGLTDEQAARLAEGVSMSSEYAKRCSELREAGLIAPTGSTRPGVSGAERIVSRITFEGSRVLTSIVRPT